MAPLKSGRRVHALVETDSHRAQDAQKFSRHCRSCITKPSADHILLFAGIAPVEAVPSNCAYVLVRLQQGPEGKNYAATYREAQRALEAQVPAKFDARTRAYLLLKRHAQETCKLTNPKCSECRVKSSCAYFATTSSQTVR